MGPSCHALKGWEAGHRPPPFTFQGRGMIFYPGSSFLVLNNASWKGWDDTGNLKLFVLLLCAAAATAAKSLQLCSTLCNPMDRSLLGSSIHGIFQARVLEWGAIAFSISLCSYSQIFCAPHCVSEVLSAAFPELFLFMDS